MLAVLDASETPFSLAPYNSPAFPRRKSSFRPLPHLERRKPQLLAFPAVALAKLPALLELSMEVAPFANEDVFCTRPLKNAVTFGIAFGMSFIPLTNLGIAFAAALIPATTAVALTLEGAWNFGTDSTLPSFFGIMVSATFEGIVDDLTAESPPNPPPCLSTPYMSLT